MKTLTRNGYPNFIYKQKTCQSNYGVNKTLLFDTIFKCTLTTCMYRNIPTYICILNIYIYIIINIHIYIYIHKYICICIHVYICILGESNTCNMKCHIQKYTHTEKHDILIRNYIFMKPFSLTEVYNLEF